MGPRGEAGPAGAAGSAIRVVNGDAQASCGDGETMISAYCVGGDGTPKISSTNWASCSGDGAKTVVACVKK